MLVLRFLLRSGNGTELRAVFAISCNPSRFLIGLGCNWAVTIVTTSRGYRRLQFACVNTQVLYVSNQVTFVGVGYPDCPVVLRMESGECDIRGKGQVVMGPCVTRWDERMGRGDGHRVSLGGAIR